MRRSGNYHRLFIHFVWATNDRQPFVTPAVETVLFAHVKSRCDEMQVQVFAINGMPDHVHLLVRLPPTAAPSDFMQFIKGGSAHFVNKCSGLSSPLKWQDGYGAISLRESEIDVVIRYISNQKRHHSDGKLSAILERTIG